MEQNGTERRASLQPDDCSAWAKNERDREYHDERWCRPVHDDRELFAMLCLEGQQCGLSWSLILEREELMRKAFFDFDYNRLAALDEKDEAAILNAEGIIRNKAKVHSVVKNARAYLKVRQEFGTFDRYIWSFTDGQVVMNHPKTFREIPAKSELSERVSRDLKKRGFSFVGPVITYSYLQGIGVINDHLENCQFKYEKTETENQHSADGSGGGHGQK